MRKPVLSLGATAAQTLLGRDFRVTHRNGEMICGFLGDVVATYHPSAVWRAPDADARQRLDASAAELVAERDAVKDLLGPGA